MSKDIKKDMEMFHKKLREEIKKKWNRVLPFNEEVTDRWEKAEFLKFGRDSSIYDSSIVLGDVMVGEHTWIGPYTILDGSGKLKIGAYCSISCGVQIYTHDSIKWALTGGKSDYEHKETGIGDNCYIGPNSIIKAGVIIGNCSVIGANSYVNKSIEPFSIVYGNPAKVHGKVKLNGGDVKFEYYKK